MKEKTTIIIVNYYLPGYKVGGPLVSLLNIVKLLGDEFNFKILTVDHDFGDSKPYPSDIKRNTWIKSVYDSHVYYIPLNIFAVFSLFKQLRLNSNSNSIVYLNSVFNPLFSIYIVVARKFGILKIKNLVLAPRGEMFNEALGFKALKKRLYLWLANKFRIYKDVIWHATNEKERDFILKAFNVPEDNIRIAMIMSDIPEDNAPVENNENEQCDLKIVFLARISKDKNVSYTLDILRNIKAKVIFDIYGPIEDQDLWDICLEKIKELPANIQVKYCGVAKSSEVKTILQRYDLFFLPTFAENYGHSIAEALSAGTPVLISDNTPWRDLEQDKLGWDLDLDNPDLFVDAINQLIAYSGLQRAENRRYIKDVIRKRLTNPEILEANKNLFRLSFH